MTKLFSFTRVFILAFGIIILFPGSAIAQTYTPVHISVNPTGSTYFNPAYESDVKTAFILMNAVFNSSEFQKLFDAKTFACWNHCKPEECVAQKRCSGTIPGKEIYDHLFTISEVAWSVHLEEKSRAALGSTCPSTLNPMTTAYYNNIKNNMPELPIAYAMAANFCHEYMHQLGFCHYSNSFPGEYGDTPDPEGFKNDIAYRVGWEAYYILKKWNQEHKPIPGLK